jgi:hypothetical protein
VTTAGKRENYSRLFSRLLWRGDEHRSEMGRINSENMEVAMVKW